MKVLVRTSFLIFMAFMLFTGCALLNQNPPVQTIPVDKGSLLVIDEASQVLNSFDLTARASSFHSYVGNAANQIIIDGDYAYLAVSLSHTILRINLAQGGAPQAYGYYGSPNPYMIALDSDRLYVTLLNNNQMSVFNKATLTLLTNVNLTFGSYPQGISVDSNHIYIATSVGYLGLGNGGNYTNGQILVLAKSNYSTVTNISVNTNPHSLIIENQTLYIASPSQYNGTGTVQKVDLTNYSVSTLSMIDAQAPGYVKWDKDSLYVTDDSWSGLGGLFIWNSVTSNTNHILAGIGLKGVAFDSEHIYCSSSYGGTVVYQINKSDLQVTALSNLGGGDMAIYQ